MEFAFRIRSMQVTYTPPFLRGDIEGVAPLVSVWLRSLEEVNEMVERWAGDLGAEAFWWVPAYEANSIGGIITHLGGSSYRLYLRGTGQEVPPELKTNASEEMQTANKASPEEVLAAFRSRMVQIREGLSGLSEAQINQMVRFAKWEVRAMHVLEHIAGHALHHTGQIITLRKLWNAQAKGEQK